MSQTGFVRTEKKYGGEVDSISRLEIIIPSLEMKKILENLKSSSCYNFRQKESGCVLYTHFSLNISFCSYYIKLVIYSFMAGSALQASW